MSQVTWRASEELVERVRVAARAEQRSMNDYVSRILDMATNPDAAGSEAERLRERLARAGLLEAEPEDPRPSRPDSARVAAARAAAGRGKPLSDYVSEGRGERLR